MIDLDDIIHWHSNEGFTAPTQRTEAFHSEVADYLKSLPILDKRPTACVSKESVLKCIPTTWLDPLLTGDSKVIHGAFDCRDIERLLRTIRDRILELPND